jgi:hypothetical protein
MKATTTETTFGTVIRNGGQTIISADGAKLRDWARRGDWQGKPSVLADLDNGEVVFDKSGQPININETTRLVPADELDAWISECLQRAGYV